MRLISAHVRVLGEVRAPVVPCPRCRRRLRRGRDADPAVGATTAARAERFLHIRMSEHDTSVRRPSTRRWRRHRTCRRSPAPVTRLRGTFQESLWILGELFECPELTDSPHFFIRRGLIPGQSHESTKFRRDGLPLSYGQITKSASADPNTSCSYESFRMGKSNAPDPCANCPYDRKVGAVSTKFHRCEGLPVVRDK